MKEYAGMASVFLASFSASTGALFGKIASNTFQTADIVLVRFIEQLVLVSLLCLAFKLNPFSEPYLAQQIVRGVLGAITFTGAIYGNAQMELSNATMIRFIGPLTTMILAKVYLKESVSNIKYFSMSIGFLGVIFVAKPAFLFGERIHKDYPNRHLAVIVNIISGITLAFSTVLTKKIINKVHILSLMYFFGLVSIFATLPLQFFKKGQSEWSNAGLPIAMGLCYFFSQGLSNLGIKSIPASVATLIQISDTIFGVLYGVLVFGETLDGFSILGCLMVLSVSLILALEKYHLGNAYHPPCAIYVQLDEKDKLADEEMELQKIVKYINK